MTPEVIFWGDVALAAYIVVGYPLLLGWLAQRFRQPIQRDALLRSVSIVIAVRNGETWIHRKLRSIQNFQYPPEQVEVIVVSDGSTDRTEELVRTFPAGNVRLIAVANAGGKAVALNLGIAAAKNEILVMTDVRQELDPSGLSKLVACFGDPRVGVASGDLVLRSASDWGGQNVGLYRRYESWIRARASEIDSMFGATGAYYAMRRELAVEVPPGTILDDMYLPLAAYFRGYRCVIEPKALAFDEAAALETEFSRKVRTLAGNWQILARYPALLDFRNRLLLHFVSYKLARLLLPFILLVVAASSFWLPSPLREGAWLAQALFYGMAAIDPILPRTLRRLSSPCRTFVVMMAAALCAPVAALLPTETLWKPTQLPVAEEKNRARFR